MLTQRILIDDGSFHLHTTVSSHGWMQLAPFTYAEGVLARVHRLHDGRVVYMQIQQTGNTSRENFLLLQTEGPVFDTDQFEIAGTVRRMLCMDWDLRPFYAYLRPLPEYAWVEATHAGRLLRAPTVWEDMVKTLLTTNTTWSQTIGMVARLMAYGDDSPYGRAFPTPAQIAAIDAEAPEALTQTAKIGYRGPYLHALATQIINGLDVEAWAVSEENATDLYKQITRLDGFGPYAAGSLLRLLGHHEFLSIDSVARDTYARWHNDGERGTDKDLQAHYDDYGVWRGLIAWMDVLRE